MTILRYTVAQDAGKALHPAYVEGQYQGGAVQGIGWALNEEYVYGADGKLQNAGFLDYRMPVASDVPMIDAILVEVPNPKHPYGVRGVGETPIVPPLGAIANAMEQATGIRFTELPMSPPKVLKALKERGPQQGLAPRMARVVLVGNLAQVTGGVAEFHLPGASVQQLFRQLGSSIRRSRPISRAGSRWPSTARSSRTPCSSRSAPTAKSSSSRRSREAEGAAPAPARAVPVEAARESRGPDVPSAVDLSGHRLPERETRVVPLQPTTVRTGPAFVARVAPDTRRPR